MNLSKRPILGILLTGFISTGIIAAIPDTTLAFAIPAGAGGATTDTPTETEPPPNTEAPPNTETTEPADGKTKTIIKTRRNGTIKKIKTVTR